MAAEKIYPITQLETDAKQLLALVADAVAVELFTIPLYMTALYSIRGTYPDGTGVNRWPGLRPGRGATPRSANQNAFNTIFTVYIQEMFHLQLAGNISSALGQPPPMTAPTYGGSTIPCVGDLRDMHGFEDVTVALGPLDEDRIKLFMAIETPDWFSPADPPKPAVPFAGGEPPAFGTIGHLYECIKEYLDLKYQKGDEVVTLFEELYVPGSVQVNVFGDLYTAPTGVGGAHAARPVGDGEAPAVPGGFDVTVPAGADAAAARAAIDTMIDAIVCQGEGGGAMSDRVAPRFVPHARGEEAPDDIELRSFWDQYSHYERFEEVAGYLHMVETFPAWWQKKGGADAWRWQDLVADPAGADAGTKEFAEARAAALNDPETAGQVNAALNQSYTNILGAIAAAWTLDEQTGEPHPFPFAAMQALYTRVATIYAANGTPRFSPSAEAPPSKADAHACQGFDPKNPGLNSCANAVIHTCASSNSCAHQGGCGYPKKPDQLPNINSCAGLGGCGAPIPAAQVFGVDLEVDGKNIRGEKVWETAWAQFKKKFPDAPKPAKPSALRLILPPS